MRKKYEKNKIISTSYEKEYDFNDHIEGFTDEEGPDIRKNDDDNIHDYTMKMFLNPDW